MLKHCHVQRIEGTRVATIYLHHQRALLPCKQLQAECMLHSICQLKHANMLCIQRCSGCKSMLLPFV